MGQEFRAKPKKIAISNPDKQQSPFFNELTTIGNVRNRGNEYNLLREIQNKFHWGLLKQIASGKFLMVGKGTNYKSMAYVGNIAAFIKYHLQNTKPGYQVFNYIDKPDLNMNELVSQVEKSINKNIPSTHFPYWLGMLNQLYFKMPRSKFWSYNSQRGTLQKIGGVKKKSWILMISFSLPGAFIFALKQRRSRKFKADFHL